MLRSIGKVGGKILVLDHQQNSGKTAENVLKLIILLIKSGFVERKCVILLLCCVICKGTLVVGYRYIAQKTP